MQWLRDAFAFPTAGEDARRRIMTGGLMGVLGFFFIPAIVVYGYYARSIRAAATGDATPPEFDDWLELIYAGAATLAVIVGWLIATVWVFAVVSIPLADSGLQQPLSAVMAVGYIYFLPAPLALYATTGDVYATTDVDNLRAVLGSRAYFRAVLGSVFVAVAAYLPFAVAVGGALVANVSEIVYALMFMILPFVTFWFQIITAHLYGSAVAAAGVEPRTDE